MLRLPTALLAIAALAASASAQISQLPAVLLQAVSATVAAKAEYAFDLELIAEDQNWSARFEPHAQPKLRLVAPARDALSSDQRRAFDRLAEQMEGPSWCAGETMGRVANVRLVREDDAHSYYTFQPTRESIRGPARRFAEHLRGEFTMIKADPDIARLRIYMPRPFSPAPLINVNRIEIGVVCARAPNGRHYAAETSSDVRGAAFGQPFDERTVQRTHDLRAAP